MNDFLSSSVFVRYLPLGYIFSEKPFPRESTSLILHVEHACQLSFPCYAPITMITLGRFASFILTDGQKRKKLNPKAKWTDVVEKLVYSQKESSQKVLSVQLAATQSDLGRRTVYFSNSICHCDPP